MVKVISLSDEAYGRLKSIKGDKSFSEVVINITLNKKSKNLMNFFGAFKENAEEWEKIKNKLSRDRKKFKLREVRF